MEKYETECVIWRERSQMNVLHLWWLQSVTDVKPLESKTEFSSAGKMQRAPAKGTKEPLGLGNLK